MMVSLEWQSLPISKNHPKTSQLFWDRSSILFTNTIFHWEFTPKSSDKLRQLRKTSSWECLSGPNVRETYVMWKKTLCQQGNFAGPKPTLRGTPAAELAQSISGVMHVTGTWNSRTSTGSPQSVYRGKITGTIYFAYFPGKSYDIY